ncbi:hypothetical protein ECG_00090 [Echinococcus granulosus]|nr:hypothetical protein ECG_00090 [Echinococcus granulosus]
MILCFKGLKVLIWLMLAGLTQACIRTSTYYRSQYRSQTHVFVPDEYRPMRPERSLEASGPLETQDFLTSIPTTRLVRMEGPNLQFASEEARWMTKGCRDRLQKLVSLVHNTWPNNDIGLRILDGWIKPPASILRHSKVITKRDYMGRHKQTLKMSVPEELVNFEALNNAQQLVSRYPSASNGLGIKVANSDNRVVMQRPLPKQSNHT